MSCLPLPLPQLLLLSMSALQVEVIRTDNTNDEVFSLLSQYVKAISKSPVSCSDTPGFIVNRLLIPYLAQVRQKLRLTHDDDDSCRLLSREVYIYTS